MNVEDLLALPVRLETEKEIVGCLVLLLAAGAGTDVIKTRSPWRVACCKEFLDALTNAFLKKDAYGARLAPPCATLIAEFLWRAPEVGQYEAAWRAEEKALLRLKGRVLCRNVCRHPLRVCTFAAGHGRPCELFHPPPQILQLAQLRLRDGDDLFKAVMAVYMEREAQGIASSPVNPIHNSSLNRRGSR